jgi:alkanesulfonate monooxygenase SsuD/methylene tetrahydromethanopterin reductase-like flavin-dependent oxidoreductase (luciferase family)
MCFANLNGFDSFWMSDHHGIYKQVEIFKNTLIRLPSRSLENGHLSRA